MLSYKIQIFLRNAWRDKDFTVDEGLKHLTNIVANKVEINNRIIHRVPKPNKTCEELLGALGVRIPTYLPYVESDVVTKVKLSQRRISK